MAGSRRNFYPSNGICRSRWRDRAPASMGSWDRDTRQQCLVGLVSPPLPWIQHLEEHDNFSQEILMKMTRFTDTQVVAIPNSGDADSKVKTYSASTGYPRLLLQLDIQVRRDGGVEAGPDERLRTRTPSSNGYMRPWRSRIGQRRTSLKRAPTPPTECNVGRGVGSTRPSNGNLARGSFTADRGAAR